MLNIRERKIKYTSIEKPLLRVLIKSELSDIFE